MPICFEGYFDHFQGFSGILVHLSANENLGIIIFGSDTPIWKYFSQFWGFRIILVISDVWGYFNQFGDLCYFGYFEGLNEIFWSF